MRFRTLLMIVLPLTFCIANVSADEGQTATPAKDGRESPLLLTEINNFEIPQGRILYERYCLFCHGEKGEGDGLNAFSLQVRPADLTKELSDRSDRQIETVIRDGGKGAELNEAMPAFGATLQNKHVAWLVEYLNKEMASR